MFGVKTIAAVSSFFSFHLQPGIFADLFVVVLDCSGHRTQFHSSATMQSALRLCPAQHQGEFSRGKPASYPSGPWGCDLCNVQLPSDAAGAWHCDECKFDVCQYCQPIPSSRQCCGNGHPGLLLMHKPAYYRGWKCDRCKQKIPVATRGAWHCPECKYDLCPNCLGPNTGAVAPGGAGFASSSSSSAHQVPRHHHHQQPVAGPAAAGAAHADEDIPIGRPSPLQLCPSHHIGVLVDDADKPAHVVSWGCDRCDRRFDATAVGVWHCHTCGYDVCPACQPQPTSLRLCVQVCLTCDETMFFVVPDIANDSRVLSFVRALKASY